MTVNIRILLFIHRMTSRREEYSSSNVVRTLHPSRPLSPPSKNTSEFDNNLGELNMRHILNKNEMGDTFLYGNIYVALQ